MTQRRALGDLDFDSAFDDPDNGWFGHVQAADPASLRDHEDLPRDDTEDTDRWPVLTLDTELASHVEDPRLASVREPGPAAEPTTTRWSDDPPPTRSPTWESRLSGSGAWDFKVAASGPRRYHPKLVVAALIAAGLVVAGIVLVVRNPGPADESPVVAPGQPTAQPTSTSTVPSPSVSSQAPLPPGLPPPPPPPTAEELSPPVVTRDYTPRRQNSPDDSNKPEIGVTRAPATRTQMSATPPPPPPPPDRNSSTPGDGPKRNGFGFGF